MASGIAAQTFAKALGKVSGSIDWASDATSWKGALYNTTGVNAWNFAADPLLYTATNEHAATGGYTAGGNQPDGPAAFTVATSSGDVFVSWDIGDFAWTSATLASVRGIAIYYDDGQNNDKHVAVGVDFGQNYAVTNGTFGVQWAAPGANGGVFYINLTP